MSRSADRNLLFGLLALQNNFHDRGALRPDEHDLLQALVAKHLEKFGGDPEKSLAALSSIGSVREDLSRIADPDLQASLPQVSAARQDHDDDPYRTVAQA